MDDYTLNICVLAVLIGLIPAAIAYSKGKSFLGWWIFGAAFFIIALPAALLTSPDREELERRQLKTGDVRKCPHCAEIIKREAKVCRYCGKSLVHSSASLSEALPPLEKTVRSLENYSENLSIHRGDAFPEPPNAPFPEFGNIEPSNELKIWVEKVIEYYIFMGNQVTQQIPIDKNTCDLLVIAKDASNWYVRCYIPRPMARSTDLSGFEEKMKAVNAVKGAIISGGSFDSSMKNNVDPQKVALVDGEKFELAYQKMIERKKLTV